MRLFAFGLGYCAARVIARGRFAHTAGTARTAEAVAEWRGRGVAAEAFADADAVAAALAGADVALISIPPDAEGDPTLRRHTDGLRAAHLRRVVYLSTVGVYGDTGGGWVDETSPLQARTPRAQARVDAEQAWGALDLPVDVLRLGGIYGPGRSPFDRLREGTARRVVKPGQVFNRIHVDDVAGAVEAVVAAGRPGATYNVVDGTPSAPEAPILFAAGLIGASAPPEEPFERARLSTMARSFYEENRRVAGERLRTLGWSPAFPSYREGLQAVYAEERG